jgi:hypothetical protein
MGKDIRELSSEEINAINAFKRLAKKWPKSLWLFSANGTLHVMKLKPNGEKAWTGMGGEGIDPDYSVAVIDILNDGGDW